MFEKEANEYIKKIPFVHGPELVRKIVRMFCKDTFKNGAEFGYNKANEWHFVKGGDLPKVSSRYWVYTGGEPFTLDFDTEVNAFGYWCLDVGENLGVRDSIFETVAERDEDDVIAWKEIVLPKEIAE